MDTSYDVVIIGSGPAGYTAGIYSSRAFLKTLLIAGPQPGGQLTTTTEIENYPGFPLGILGPTLLEEMKKQAERFGTALVQDTVAKISLNDNQDDGYRFIVATGEQVYKAKTIIIATGAQAKTLGIETEEQFRGKGISYCATCDGFFFRNKHIAVLGGGDTAMEEATFLTKFASHVTIIHRRGEFRASPIMVEKAKNDPKISFLLNKEVVSFYGEHVLKGITLKDVGGTNEEQVPFDGVFVAIGHTPATKFLQGFIALDEKGYILLEHNQLALKPQTQTSIKGVFAAGDCVDPRYRQGIVAAGMGAMAAIDADRYLNE